jgi:hypothetical protein
VPLSTELRLNGLHVEKGTPKLDDMLIVSRGDQFKLVLGLALQHRQNRFTELDIILDLLLEDGAEWRFGTSCGMSFRRAV